MVYVNDTANPRTKTTKRQQVPNKIVCHQFTFGVFGKMKSDLLKPSNICVKARSGVEIYFFFIFTD